MMEFADGWSHCDVHAGSPALLCSLVTAAEWPKIMFATEGESEFGQMSFMRLLGDGFSISLLPISSSPKN